MMKKCILSFISGNILLITNDLASEMQSNITLLCFCSESHYSKKYFVILAFKNNCEEELFRKLVEKRYHVAQYILFCCSGKKKDRSHRQNTIYSGVWIGMPNLPSLIYPFQVTKNLFLINDLLFSYVIWVNELWKNKGVPL